MATVANPPNLRMLRRFAMPQDSPLMRGGERGGGAGVRGSAAGGVEPLPTGNYLPTGAQPGDYTPGRNGTFLGLGDKQPQLTTQGQASQQAEQQFEQGLSQRVAGGMDFRGALQDLIKDPAMLTALVLHPQLQTFIDNQQKIAAEAGKNTVFSESRGQVINKDTGTAQNVTDESGNQIGPAKAGSIQQMGTDANGNPIYETIPGAGSKAAPGIKYAPAGKGVQTQIIKGGDGKYHLMIKNDPTNPDNNGKEIGLGGTPTSAQANAAARGQMQSATTAPGISTPAPTGGGKYLAQDERVVTAGPIVNNALNTLQQLKDQTGPITGFVKIDIGGKYTGVNPAGEKMAAAFNALNAHAPQIWGGQQGGFTKAMLDTLPSENQAPSYVATLAQQKQADLRSLIQSRADLMAARGGQLPRSLENKLEGMGVYSQGYQQDADAMWTLRNNPGALVGHQITELNNWEDLHPDQPMSDSDKQMWLAAVEQSSAQKANQIANPPKPITPQVPSQQQQQQPSQQQQPPATAAPPTAAPQGQVPVTPQAMAPQPQAPQQPVPATPYNPATDVQNDVAKGP